MVCVLHCELVCDASRAENCEYGSANVADDPNQQPNPISNYQAPLIASTLVRVKAIAAKPRQAHLQRSWRPGYCEASTVPYGRLRGLRPFFFHLAGCGLVYPDSGTRIPVLCAKVNFRKSQDTRLV